MSTLSPIESEFATTEEAEGYHVWFRAKVLESIADKRPAVSQDAVMDEMESIIAEAERLHG